MPDINPQTLREISMNIRQMLAGHRIPAEVLTLNVLITKEFYETVKANFPDHHPAVSVVSAAGKEWSILLNYSPIHEAALRGTLKSDDYQVVESPAETPQEKKQFEALKEQIETLVEQQLREMGLSSAKLKQHTVQTPVEALDTEAEKSESDITPEKLYDINREIKSLLEKHEIPVLKLDVSILVKKAFYDSIKANFPDRRRHPVDMVVNAFDTDWTMQIQCPLSAI